MKNHIRSINSQRGAASLFTALILLICITLVTFLTAKTVLVATQMTANNYRSAQAFAAANAAMDYALAYFGDPGNTTFACDDPPVDASGDPLFIQDHEYEGGENLPTTRASVCIDNTTDRPLPTPWGVTIDTTCVTNSGATTAGMIIATGWSDDGQAQRTLTQCIGTRSLLAGNGPDQTLVSGGAVGLTGNASIINRFNDLNIWSAGGVNIGSSAMETYIRPTGTEINDLSYNELTAAPQSGNTDAENNIQKVSSSGLGTGTDVYQNDRVLTAAKSATDASATGDGPDTFFDLFFPEMRKAEIARSAQAAGQYYDNDNATTDYPEPTTANLSGRSGIIYVEGDASFQGGAGTTLGSPDAPVLLFVDGNFQLTGGTIYGAIYITGQLTGGGNPAIHGTVIAESGVNRGAGTMDLVYSPFGDGSGDGSLLPGLTGVIAGSWRDW